MAGRLNGKPSAVIAVYQLPGSNAVATAEGVRKLFSEAKKRFPGDMDFRGSGRHHAGGDGGHEGDRRDAVASPSLL